MFSKLRWQILIIILALVAIAFLLTRQPPQVTEQEVIQAVQPSTGGVYTEALVGAFGRLNPLLDLGNQPDRDIDQLLFSGLVDYDDRGLPRGDLAESWGISQDGKVYNFSLRPTAVWHDGTPVTSGDVVYTIGLLLDEALPFPQDKREFWQRIEVIDLDERTIQFRLPEPFAPFLDYLTFGILPRHKLQAVSAADLINDPINLHPIGTGPYQFDRLLVEGGQIQGVVLNAFEGYYRERSFIDQIVFQYYPTDRAALTAYQEGDVDGIGEITAQILPEALDELSLNLYTGRLPQLTLIYFNLDNPELAFFQESDIRQALLMGLNRQRMIDNVLGGQGIIADGPIFPGTWAYYDDIERIEYTPDKALEAIKDAGYAIPADGGSVRVKDGNKLNFELVYPDDEMHNALAESIQRDWMRLGVGVELKAVDYETLMGEYLEPRRYEAALVDLNMTQSPDPDPYPFWAQGQITGGQNYAKWDDRQASEYLERARITSDVNERAKAYRNFQVRFTSEIPALPLFYPVYTMGVDEKVQGVTIGPLFDPSERFATITSWYLIARRSSGSIPTDTPTTAP